MTSIWTEFAQRIDAGSGGTLAIIGMGVVFTGLLTLFFAMLILEKTMIYIEHRKKEKMPSSSATLILETNELNMDEVAAAIGLALHLYKIRHSSREIKIKQLSHSQWKQSHRARALERL